MIFVAVVLFVKRDLLVKPLFLDQEQAEEMGLQKEMPELEKDTEYLSRNQPPSQPFQSESPLPGTAYPSIDFRNTSCTEIDRKIQEFFSQLEVQEYLGKHRLSEGAQERLTKITDKLISTPPIVVRETDSLFSILTNTAHFYRVLGKDDLFLLKDLVLQQGDFIETDLALFYQWSISSPQCQAPQTAINLPLDGLYEYAGFFLNTLGGQAYLFRRDARLRLLVKYYCVLIIDRANAQIMNRHGIDIHPHLESLVQELEVSESLAHRDYYLRILRGLQDKYLAFYQPGNSVSQKN